MKVLIKAKLLKGASEIDFQTIPKKKRDTIRDIYKEAVPRLIPQYIEDYGPDYPPEDYTGEDIDELVEAAEKRYQEELKRDFEFEKRSGKDLFIIIHVNTLDIPIASIEDVRMYDYTIKAYEIVDFSKYDKLRSEARDLQNGEMSGILREPSKTSGLAEEDSALDRVLRHGILPKNVGKFLTSEEVQGLSVKPAIRNLSKKVRGKARRKKTRKIRK